MSVRRIAKFLFGRAGPVMYTANLLFTKNRETEKPMEDRLPRLDPLDPKELTTDYMIRQSTLSAVNAASQILTVTYVTVEATSKEYRSSLGKLITLLEDSIIYDLGEAQEDEIIETRAEVQHQKQTLLKLISFMEYVHKMAVSTSEVTFMSGMDDICTTLCQRIDDAMNNVKRETQLNEQLEAEYDDIQLQCITKSRAKEESQRAKEQNTKEEVNID